MAGEDDFRGEPEPRGGGRSRLLLAGVLAALFAAMLGYRVLHAGRLEETALFYVGLPAAIALTVVFAARPRSAAGVATATTAVGLALAGPLLDEGVVCLVVAAPLFLGVAALVGWLADRARGGPSTLALAPVLALACLDGAASGGALASWPEHDAATAVRTVAAEPGRVAAALAAEPAYEQPPGGLLALGFPRPLSAAGTGLDLGDERLVRFTPRRSLGPGAEPEPRSMALRVTESESRPDGGRAVFTVTADTTLARWLDLERAEVRWRARPGGGTELAWTLHYRRTYDPGWYFGPIQRYAAGEAAGYLAAEFAALAAGPAHPVRR
ncbi:hypothetical protein [Allonocardiopsis opalescens]|uniref:Uncharacterized protein n=1 Tax=Allonocardiopsis opalescens TaxID=1144618 RepID=A0A2T0PWV8_9ACTN|nr:hypothetical protein [Allonocardiopsis opalescens]PRX96029.1 hypothetical protein CLV72_10833 [Allonocardiopsis opalescens]